MTKDDLGQMFIRNGVLYECIGYINDPALTLKNIDTGVMDTIVIGSRLSEEFHKIGHVTYPPKDKIEELKIIQEKNCKNNYKWKIKGDEHYYNISTPQKIIADKLNEVIKIINKGGFK